jgi:antitoxin component of RelBE/YafQ-DinJ toxin-antitoxin module
MKRNEEDIALPRQNTYHADDQDTTGWNVLITFSEAHMSNHTILLNIDEHTQAEAAAFLRESGLSVEDFLYISLDKLAAEKRLPEDMHNTAGSQAVSEKSLGDYSAFGMWADREDMKNPSGWVRKQRDAGRHDY